MTQSLISILALSALVAATPLEKRQTSCSETYWSQASDTCDSIGAMFGLTGDAIKQYNDYVDCNDIWVNTPICIGPLPSVTTIFPSYAQPSTTSAPTCVETWWSQEGDSCQSIGALFGLTEGAIFDANTYLNCSDIWVNTPVCIPYLPSVTTIFPGGPTGVADPVSSSSTSCVETWWSQAGDTCQGIGAIFGLTEQTIIDANTYLNCSDIWVNTPVCIPYLPSVTTIFPTYPTSSLPVVTAVPTGCFITYTSVQGDDCNSIGSQFGLTGTQIWDANQFLNCDDIWAYTPICIPYAVDTFPLDPDATVPVPTSTVFVSDVFPTAN